MEQLKNGGKPSPADVSPVESPSQPYDMLGRGILWTQYLVVNLESGRIKCLR